MSTYDHKLTRNFFGAYFHQDCFCEAETWEQVVQGYMHDASPWEITRLKSSIMTLVESGLSDEALGKELDELGCEYLPSADGFTVKEWLIHVTEVLRPSPPTWEGVLQQLQLLATGAITPGKASEWATPWITRFEEIDDAQVKRALDVLAGADMIVDVQGNLLHGPVDFKAWLAEFIDGRL